MTEKMQYLNANQTFLFTVCLRSVHIVSSRQDLVVELKDVYAHSSWRDFFKSITPAICKYLGQNNNLNTSIKILLQI